MIRFLAPLILSLSMMSCSAAETNQPEEAGKVAWGRDLEVALAASETDKKPVFALFQEIPGCAGCKQFGRDVLSNPLLVEAIQAEFTPLLIHNNKAGNDAEVLKRFDEPAWNYQVVRFLDAHGKDVIPRRDQVWETCPLAERMITTLTTAKRPVPEYLRLLAREHSKDIKQAVFAMACLWTGEMKLGQIEGVVSTEAGFMAGNEVTLVRYDAATLPLPKLIAAAEQVHCAEAVYVPAEDLANARASRLKTGAISGYRTAPASDQKKRISGTAVAKLNLTGAQATKVNAWIREDSAKAIRFLTPGQIARLRN